MGWVLGNKWCDKLCHEIGMRRIVRLGSIQTDTSFTVNAAKCQEECQASLPCEYWSFDVVTKNCTQLSGPGNLEPAPASTDTSPTGISGPKYCERSKRELILGCQYLWEFFWLCTKWNYFEGESHVNHLEFEVTVKYPTQLDNQARNGPENLFDGDVMEFDTTYFDAFSSSQPTTTSTPQM